jgi:hypothetical protein
MTTVSDTLISDPMEVWYYFLKKKDEKIRLNGPHNVTFDADDAYATKTNNWKPFSDLLILFTSRDRDWLRARRSRGGSSSPGKAKNFIFHHIVQTGPGAHPASYPMGTWGSFPGSKADRSPLPCDLYIQSPYAFMA